MVTNPVFYRYQLCAKVASPARVNARRGFMGLHAMPWPASVEVLRWFVVDVYPN